MAVNSGVKSSIPLNYTVPVPVLVTNKVYQNTKVKFKNIQTSDVIITDGDAGSIIGVQKTCTVSLKNTDMQTWYDNTTAPKTYTYDVVQYGSFTGGTDEELAKAVADSDAGLIDLYDDCGWRVGDTRNIKISAIPSNGTYDGISWSGMESVPEKTISIKLVQRGRNELVVPTIDKQGNPKTNCDFIVMTTNVSTGAIAPDKTSNQWSWWGIERRNWSNGGFRQALNKNIRSCFKKFKCITGNSNATTLEGNANTITEDYFAIPAEKEITNTRAYSTKNEADALSAFDDNTIKSYDSRHIFRSPVYTNTTHYAATYWYQDAYHAEPKAATDTSVAINLIGVI